MCFLPSSSFFGAFLYAGYQTFPDLPVVGGVLSGTSAEKQGIEKGDTILTVAGRKVDTWTDIGKITKTLDTRIVPVTVSHEGEEKTLTIMMTDGDNGRPIIGISPTWNTMKWARGGPSHGRRALPLPT